MTRTLLALPLILAACIPATTCHPRPGCDPATPRCACERPGHGDARAPLGKAPDHGDHHSTGNTHERDL